MNDRLSWNQKWKWLKWFWNPEQTLLQAYPSLSAFPPGLQASWDRFFKKKQTFPAFSIPPPTLHLIPSALPFFQVVRTPGSPGLFLLSEGLLFELSEKRLEALFQMGFLRLHRPGIWAYSFFLQILVRFLSLAGPWQVFCWPLREVTFPRPVGRFQTSLRQLRFLLCWPWIRLFSFQIHKRSFWAAQNPLTKPVFASNLPLIPLESLSS